MRVGWWVGAGVGCGMWDDAGAEGRRKGMYEVHI
jgi:hypothetical protein